MNKTKYKEEYDSPEKELEKLIESNSIRAHDKDVHYIYIALPYYLNQLNDLDMKESVKCLELYIKSFKPTLDHLLENDNFNKVLSIFFGIVKLRDQDLLEKLSCIESRNIHKFSIGI